jgi:hypothetical protein
MNQRARRFIGVRAFFLGTVPAVRDLAPVNLSVSPLSEPVSRSYSSCAFSSCALTQQLCVNLALTCLRQTKRAMST